MQKENIELLNSSLKELGLETSDDIVNMLVKYHDHLMSRNSIHNLTGHKDEDRSVKLNLINSLGAFTAFRDDFIKNNINLSNHEISDIGTGAGLPGIPWSILLPEARFFLVDSKEKKVNFLREVVELLQLKNVTLMQINANEIKQRFETLVFQAFGKTAKIVKVIDTCMKPNGNAYIFAANPDKLSSELDAFDNFQYKILPFKLPHMSEYERNLVCITRVTNKTDEK